MIRPLRALRRFVGLGAADRRIALEAIALGPPIEASLRLVGLERTQAWLSRVVPLVTREEPATASPAELEKLITSALRWTPLRGACLQLALVQVALERRRGHDVRMAIGVRCAEGGGIVAHAWVEPRSESLEPPTFKRIWTWVP